MGAPAQLLGIINILHTHHQDNITLGKHFLTHFSVARFVTIIYTKHKNIG